MRVDRGWRESSRNDRECRRLEKTESLTCT